CSSDATGSGTSGPMVPPPLHQRLHLVEVPDGRPGADVMRRRNHAFRPPPPDRRDGHVEHLGDSCCPSVSPQRPGFRLPRHDRPSRQKCPESLLGFPGTSGVLTIETRPLISLPAFPGPLAGPQRGAHSGRYLVFLGVIPFWRDCLGAPPTVP